MRMCACVRGVVRGVWRGVGACACPCACVWPVHVRVHVRVRVPKHNMLVMPAVLALDGSVCSRTHTPHTACRRWWRDACGAGACREECSGGARKGHAARSAQNIACDVRKNLARASHGRFCNAASWLMHAGAAIPPLLPLAGGGALPFRISVPDPERWAPSLAARPPIAQAAAPFTEEGCCELGKRVPRDRDASRVRISRERPVHAGAATPPLPLPGGGAPPIPDFRSESGTPRRRAGTGVSPHGILRKPPIVRRQTLE